MPILVDATLRRENSSMKFETKENGKRGKGNLYMVLRVSCVCRVRCAHLACRLDQLHLLSSLYKSKGRQNLSVFVNMVGNERIEHSERRAGEG